MKRLIILIIAIGMVAVGGVGAWTYSDLRRPISHAKTGQYIEIPKGTSPSSIIMKLAAEGVIRHEWPLKLYLKVTGKAQHSRLVNMTSRHRYRHWESCRNSNRANGGSTVLR